MYSPTTHNQASSWTCPTVDRSGVVVLGEALPLPVTMAQVLAFNQRGRRDEPTVNVPPPDPYLAPYLPVPGEGNRRIRGSPSPQFSAWR
jgi:hypothetical protein